MHVRFALCFAALLLAALVATFGQDGRATAQSSVSDVLHINEFMADNETAWIDPDDPGLDEYPDWIELYNSGGVAVSLTGVYITDDPAVPLKFAFTTGLSIPADSFVVFYADDEEETEGAYHLGFRLSKSSGYIGLFTGNPENPTEIDSYSYGPQDNDVATGRLPDGTGPFQRLPRPSPGHTNLVTSPRISAVERTPDLPTASTPVQVSATITDDKPGIIATLFYSVNGTGPVDINMAPLAQSQRYGGTIPPQPDGSVVEYRLEAKDSDGQMTPDTSFELPILGRYVVGYNVPPIVINEVVADNHLGYEDPDDPGDYPDWIEIHNTSNQAVSLDGLYFTDDLAEPTKFAIANGLTIQPRGYLIFLADRDPEQGSQHLDFRLNRAGESIAIFGALGSVMIDSMQWNNVPTGLGYGRFPNGTGEATFLYCTTPGDANLLCDRQSYLPSISRPNAP